MARSEDYKAGRISSVIGRQTFIEGTLTGKELLRIDGNVKGTVLSEGRVIIGCDGYVEGTLRVHELIVGGIIEGEIFSDGKVEVNKTGKIFGDIHTKALIVDENARFEGRCEMIRDDESSQPDEEEIIIEEKENE